MSKYYFVGYVVDVRNGSMIYGNALVKTCGNMLLKIEELIQKEMNLVQCPRIMSLTILDEEDCRMLSGNNE